MPATGKVTASDGKVLTLAVIQPSHMLDLMEVAGAEASGNGAWMQYALWVSSVQEVDGVPLPKPTTREQVRANADRIGFAAIAAVRGWDGGDEVTEESKELAKN